MIRRFRLKPEQTAEEIAKLGGGSVQDIKEANHFLNAEGAGKFYPWNPGQHMNVPTKWAAYPGEFPAE